MQCIIIPIMRMGQPSEKNSFDLSKRQMNRIVSHTNGMGSQIPNGMLYMWLKMTMIGMNDDTHPNARKIFEYYENKYGTSELDCTIIDSIIGDLKDAALDYAGFDPLVKESKDQKLISSKKCFKTHLAMQVSLPKKIPSTLSKKTLTKKVL